MTFLHHILTVKRSLLASALGHHILCYTIVITVIITAMFAHPAVPTADEILNIATSHCKTSASEVKLNLKTLR